VLGPKTEEGQAFEGLNSFAKPEDEV